MSLSFEKLTNSSKKIANSFINKIHDYIYISDIDELGEDDKELTKIRLNDENDLLFPYIPDYELKQPELIYITGSTGCGKTLFCRNYVLSFLHKYPKSRVLLFSSKTKDINLDDLKITRMKIDEDILINQISLDEIEDKNKPVLVIFDDIQDFKNKKINIEVARLRDEILRNGRDRSIYGLFVYHDPTDYHNTKTMIKECNKFVIFPRRAGVGIYDRLMTTYLKIPSKYQNMMLKLKSRFVLINRNVPRYILTDKYILLI